jgi:hypothetical protein
MSPIVWSAAGQASDLQAVLQQALDQSMQLAIKDMRVIDAFETIGRESGVTITIDQECLDLLPYGADTRVNAELRNIPLRQGLAALLAGLGMSFEVRDHVLEVVPQEPLARLGRRATFEELKLLSTLAERRWTPDGAGGVETFRDRIQFKEVPEKDPWAALVERVERVGAGKASELLNLACKSLGWTWYPSGDQIVITPEAKQVERQLERPVSVRTTRRPMIDALQELGRRAGVRLRVDPQAHAALPISTRQNFNLLVENASGREALDRIAAATGLAWRIDGDAVTFFQPGAQPNVPQPTSAEPMRDPVLFLLAVPGPDGRSTIQIPVRESEVSAELKRFREEQIDEFNRLVTDYLKSHPSAARRP